MTIGNLAKLIQLNPPQLLAISLVSGLLLFLSDSLLEQIGIKALRDQYRPWIGIIFLVFIGLLFSKVVFSTAERIQRERAKRVKKKEVVKALENLTPREKEILGSYIRDNTKTKILSSDGVVGGLRAKGILYQSSQYGRMGWSDAPDFPFNISDFVWVHLNEHPNLIASDKKGLAEELKRK